MTVPLAKPVMSLLSRLFAAEVTRALGNSERKGWPLLGGLHRTLAVREAVTIRLIEYRVVRVTATRIVEGYELTSLGRLTYCAASAPVAV